MIKNFVKSIFTVAIAAVLFTSCDKDENTSLTMNFSGLDNLGADYVYEGWLMVDGAPVTAGIFTVDNDGVVSTSSFEFGEDLEKATAYILTIEPANDPDPAPSDVHILAGDFSGNSAALTVGHGAALGSDFTASTGGFILATPTTADDTDEKSGVWFLDNSSGSMAVGLDLPTLPAGWAYEGWAVIDGQPVSTGRFTALDAADDAAPFSGSGGGPAYPGEDFIQNAPTGLTFPINLDGSTIVVSIEPVPDNSAAPFTLKPLVKVVEAGSGHHTFISMDNNAATSNPTGSVSR